MRKSFYIVMVSLVLAASACVRESLFHPRRVENGEPVMLTIGIGTSEMTSVEVRTKTEVSRADESTVHDLYVFLFDGSSGEKIYGRYFSYENRESTSSRFSDSDKECWFVENKTMAGITPAVENTRGAVKLSTVSNDNCTLVILANVSNTLTSMNGQDVLQCLNGITSMTELRNVKVELQKNTVERKNLFLMMGMRTGMDSGSMQWNKTVDFDEDTRVMLDPIDAKIKFRIKKKDENISRITPRYWQVCRVPGSCYLFSDANSGKDPADAPYFDTAQSYFEDTEIEGGVEYQVFCFYMLENRLSPKNQVNSYYLREKQEKEDDTDYPGFKKNGLWKNANDNSTFVRFDMVLTLTSDGIDELGQSVGHALTTDAVFTVHLGDFTNSNSTNSTALNDYNTLRGHSYTYDITINNSKSIYTEVMSDGRDQEDQPGQEGFLLLTNDEIINCDAHYEYHSMTFRYNPDLDPEKYSWFIKTPFSEGGPETVLDGNIYRYPPKGEIDYAWVKFSINPLKGDGTYSLLRSSYPGEKNGQYNPAWKVGDAGDRPVLMDVSQLVSFIVDQNRRKAAGDNDGILFDSNNVIIVTAFIDEYYYEKHPFTGETDTELWREFVNAKPRELHILSDAITSLDRQSDVIESSHSIIQESIQTIYNIYNPELRSLWGTEHKDEMKAKNTDGWPWGTPAGNGNNYDNGRENTAKLWGVYNGSPNWDTFLKYDVDNDTPELREEYRQMAYSCMTRNRDNDGDHVIDADEVRWYLASINQLIGTWIGNEALSSTARPYQPVYDENDPTWWHAHVVSSTYSGGTPLVLTAEEGISYYKYTDKWVPGWDDEATANKHRSVRCVRNVGTYDSDGVKDISYAPFSEMFNQYYTRTDNADSTYSIQFSRMSPKALRDYSPIDFSKHFETSPNNKVYLEIIAQNPAKTRIPDGNPDKLPYGKWEDMGVIIENIDREGRNLYCPDGYRLPNQRELAIMSLALPSSYWSSTLNYLPSCTLYSRGKYGTNDELYNGKRKLGWVKSTGKIHLPVEGEYSKYFRCVKDKDLTGTILGQINVKDKLVCAGDYTTLDFKFSSTESVLTSAVMTLCYTDKHGQYCQRDIPVNKTPTSLQYNVTQTYHVPSLAELGIETLPCPMTIKLALRNAAGKREEFSTDFTLIATHLKDVDLEFPQLFSVDKGLPIQVNVSSVSKSAPISSVKLYWKAKGDASYNEVDMGVEAHSNLYNVSLSVYLKDLIGDVAFGNKSFEGVEYQYYAVATSSDGSSLASSVQSMQILRFDYTPNPVPDGGWTLQNKSQCNGIWDNRIDNLDFSEGDYIEADIDLSNCVYVYLKGTEADDMGKDNIFGFSTNDVNSITNSIIWYYPSVQYLVAPPGNTGWTKMRIHAGRWAALELTGVVTEINLILDKDGILRDGTRFTGNPGDWNSRVKAALTGASTIYVGSKEGSHHSRATYRYVRVIRKHD